MIFALHIFENIGLCDRLTSFDRDSSTIYSQGDPQLLVASSVSVSSCLSYQTNLAEEKRKSLHLKTKESPKQIK